MPRHCNPAIKNFKKRRTRILSPPAANPSIPHLNQSYNRTAVTILNRVVPQVSSPTRPERLRIPISNRSSPNRQRRVLCRPHSDKTSVVVLAQNQWPATHRRRARDHKDRSLETSDHRDRSPVAPRRKVPSPVAQRRKVRKPERIRNLKPHPPQHKMPQTVPRNRSSPHAFWPELAINQFLFQIWQSNQCSWSTSLLVALQCL